MINEIFTQTLKKLYIYIYIYIYIKVMLHDLPNLEELNYYYYYYYLIISTHLAFG